MNTIEEFRIEHVEPAAILLVESFNSPPWKENWTVHNARRRLRDILETPGFKGLVYKGEKNIVGFLVGNIEYWDTYKSFYINEICVQNKHQSIGTDLIEELENQLKQVDIEHMHLSTVSGEKYPEKFFEKMGYYSNSNRIIMEKSLCK